jgi:predicted nucleic acid-binding protein
MEDFDEMRQDYEMLGTDSEAVLDKASEIYANLKRRGRLLPDADILIAAVAMTYNLTLVTADSHFDRIEDLKVENWLTEKETSVS